MTTPTQGQVDQCGHYAEAVGELMSSLFFGVDTRNLGCTTLPTGQTIYRVSERVVVDAMLHPFRRIWQQDEVTHFRTIRNLLWTHGGSDTHAGYLVYAEEEFKRSSKDYGPGEDSTIPPKDLVDAWLNTQAAHTGAKAKNGRFTRADFDRFSVQMGPSKLEYLFQLAILNYSCCFSTLGQINAICLRRWAERTEPSPEFCTSTRRDFDSRPNDSRNGHRPIPRPAFLRVQSQHTTN